MSVLLGPNLAGGEFGGANQPGRYAYDYIYPSREQVDWYALQGMRIIRVPFFSSRVIRNNVAYKADIDALMAVVDQAARRGMSVVLDLHEYAKKPDGTLWTTSAADLAAFRRIWRVLAGQFRSRGNVVFGLMNEPMKQTPEDWFTIAKAGLAGIREVAPTLPVTVMGSYWGTADDFATLNGPAFDAAGFDEYVMVEAHQYFDGKGGKPDDGHRAIKGKGASSLVAVTEWARARGRKLFLGEFGFTADPGDMAEGKAILEHMTANSDVWWGATIWAGGLWWAEGKPRQNGPYAFSVEPRDCKATACAPQLQLMRAFV